MNTDTSNLLLALDTQRQNLAANLSQKGVAATANEGLETLVPKVLEIAAGGGTDNVDFSWVISSRTTQNNQYTIFPEWKTVMPDLDKVYSFIGISGDNVVICTKENFQNRTDKGSNILYVPGQMYALGNSNFQTWDVARYKTGMLFYPTRGVFFTMNNSELTADTKTCFITVQERS